MIVARLLLDPSARLIHPRAGELELLCPPLLLPSGEVDNPEKYNLLLSLDMHVDMLDLLTSFPKIV